MHVGPLRSCVVRDPVADPGGDEPVQPGAVPLVQVAAGAQVEVVVVRVGDHDGREVLGEVAHLARRRPVPEAGRGS